MSNTNKRQTRSKLKAKQARIKKQCEQSEKNLIPTISSKCEALFQSLPECDPFSFEVVPELKQHVIDNIGFISEIRLASNVAKLYAMYEWWRSNGTELVVLEAIDIIRDDITEHPSFQKYFFTNDSN